MSSIYISWSQQQLKKHTYRHVHMRFLQRIWTCIHTNSCPLILSTKSQSIINSCCHAHINKHSNIFGDRCSWIITITFIIVFCWNQCLGNDLYNLIEFHYIFISTPTTRRSISLLVREPKYHGFSNVTVVDEQINVSHFIQIFTRNWHQYPQYAAPN